MELIIKPMNFLYYCLFIVATLAILIIANNRGWLDS